MRLDLDDDCIGKVLVLLLRNAGHDVRLPADIGLAGASDAAHQLHAIRDNRLILSRNYRDFADLHELVLAAQGHHPGILVICKDNNPKNDLSLPQIVRAIANLLATGMPLADQYMILNQWR